MNLRVKKTGVFIIFLLLSLCLVSASNHEWIGIMAFNDNEYDLAKELDVETIRGRINWRDVETSQDNFVWTNQEIVRIENHLNSGGKVIPTIKIKGGKWPYWAVDNTGLDPAKDCSFIPADFEEEFNPEYGHSESYYDFISELLTRYDFEVIVIENEEDVIDFWCDTGDWEKDMERYIKIVKTAKKAVEDVDPGVKVANGGFGSGAIPYVIVNETLSEGDDQKALDFWHETMKHNENAEDVPMHTFLNFFENNPNAHRKVFRVNYLLDKLPDTVDIFNFHYKENLENYPEIIDYVRSRVGNIPIMDNELGTKQQPADNIYDEGAKDTVKFFVYAYYYDFYKVIWYPPDHGVYSHTGVIDSEGNYIPETLGALNASIRFLNKDFDSVEDISDSQFSRFEFTSPYEKIEVVWPKNDLDQTNVPQDCSAYDYRNRQINDVIDIYPAFIVCSLCNTDSDVNCDGSITLNDIIQLLNKFGNQGNPGWIAEDVKKDGKIDVFDLVLVARDIGK